MNNVITSSYSRIFWGFLFIFFIKSVLIHSFGFFLISSGFYILTTYHKSFYTSSFISFLAACICFIGFFAAILSNNIVLFLEIMKDLFIIWIVYKVLKSIIFFCNSMKKYALSMQYHRLLLGYSFLTFFTYLSFFFYSYFNLIAQIVITTIYILIHIDLLYNIHKAKKELQFYSPSI